MEEMKYPINDLFPSHSIALSGDVKPRRIAIEYCQRTFDAMTSEKWPWFICLERKGPYAGRGFFVR
jgi:hypothetical protein